MRGFTLIEAMVALAIVALGMIAVFMQLGRYAESAIHIETKTLASWIATNRITELSVASTWPALGKDQDDVDFAGRMWHLRIEVEKTPVDNLRRVDVLGLAGGYPGCGRGQGLGVHRAAGAARLRSGALAHGRPRPAGGAGDAQVNGARELRGALGGDLRREPLGELRGESCGGSCAGEPGKERDRARSRERGFTLIEMLVAMAIVAVIGIMALGGLNTVIKERDTAKAHAERWREIQFAMRMIEQDLSEIHPRPTRDELGEAVEPAVLSNPDAQYALEFSRGGWTNPAGFKRGSVLRVAYALKGDTLERVYWPVMDRTLATPPVTEDLLTGVDSLEIRFLDPNGEWQAQWPAVGASGPEALVSRPRAIEITLDLHGFGTIRRLVETSS